MGANSAISPWNSNPEYVPQSGRNLDIFKFGRITHNDYPYCKSWFYNAFYGYVLYISETESAFMRLDRLPQIMALHLGWILGIQKGEECYSFFIKHILLFPEQLIFFIITSHSIKLMLLSIIFIYYIYIYIYIHFSFLHLMLIESFKPKIF